jgi:hypothetical protein
LISKIRQWHRGKISEQRDSCILTVQKNLNGIPYCFETEPGGESFDIDQARRDSVGKRQEYLIEDPWCLYLDTDMMLEKPFDFEFSKDNKPYVYIHPAQCPACAIFGNGNTRIIKEIYEQWKSPLNNGLYRCICVFIRQRIGEFNFFPSGYLNHLRLRGNQ